MPRRNDLGRSWVGVGGRRKDNDVCRSRVLHCSAGRGRTY